MRRSMPWWAAAAVLLAATPAAGQSYSWSAGWYGGAFYITSMNSGVGTPSVDIKPGVSWLAGLTVDQWWGRGYVGLRYDGAIAKHQIQWSEGDRNVTMGLVDLALLLRPVAGQEGRVVTPFIALGVGAVGYGLGSGPTVSYPEANAVYPGKNKWRFAPVGGLGFDIDTGFKWDDEPVILRLEGMDHVVLKSPFRPASTTGDFSMVHNARVTLGLRAGIGSLFPSTSAERMR